MQTSMEELSSQHKMKMMQKMKVWYYHLGPWLKMLQTEYLIKTNTNNSEQLCIRPKCSISLKSVQFCNKSAQYVGWAMGITVVFSLLCYQSLSTFITLNDSTKMFFHLLQTTQSCRCSARIQIAELGDIMNNNALKQNTFSTTCWTTDSNKPHRHCHLANNFGLCQTFHIFHNGPGGAPENCLFPWQVLAHT